MDIKKLSQEKDHNAVIEELKSGRNAPHPDMDKILSQLEPSKHDIFDKVKRPDKIIKVDNPEPSEKHQFLDSAITDGEKEQTKLVPVARIALAIQKLIVKRAASFTFGNPVTLSAEPDGEDEKTVLKAVKKILFNTKSRTVNKTVAKEIFSTTEAAELWYPVEKPTNYGFPSKFKLRVTVLRPTKGDKLYPCFDETGDMVAFSREFIIKGKKGKGITCRVQA